MAKSNVVSAKEAGIFKIGNERTVNRLGFGAMRLTGPGIWGEPKNPKAAGEVLKKAIELRDLKALKIILNWPIGRIDNVGQAYLPEAINRAIVDYLDDDDKTIYISTILTHPHVNIANLLQSLEDPETFSDYIHYEDFIRLDNFIRRQTNDRSYSQKLLNTKKENEFSRLIELIVNNDNVVDLIIEEARKSFDGRSIRDYVIINYRRTSEELWLRIATLWEDEKIRQLFFDLLKDRWLIITDRVLDVFREIVKTDDTVWNALAGHPNVIGRAKNPPRKYMIRDLEFLKFHPTIEQIKALSSQGRFQDGDLLKMSHFQQFFSMSVDQLAKELNEHKVVYIPYVTTLTSILILTFRNQNPYSKDQRRLTRLLTSFFLQPISRLLPAIILPEEYDGEHAHNLMKIKDLNV